MYIDIVPNRKSPPAILLRESYRENGKVKKRTLANLSRLPTNVISAIRDTLAGKSKNKIAIEECYSGAVYGILFVLKQLAKNLGIINALGHSKLATLALFLILARIAHQGSRLSAVRWAQDHAVKEILALDHFDEDHLYQALDWIAINQDKIETALYKKYLKDNAIPPTLVLYDVTSSYLEGEHNELAAFGYNRDGKKGKMEIVIGLLTTEDGEPLSVQVFKGNTSDTQTFNQQVDKITERFNIKNVVFVGDRGMIKNKGKDYLGKKQDDHFSYITALTDPQIKKLIDDKVIQHDLFDENITEVLHGSKRLVLRCNPAVKSKEQHRREDKLRCLKEKIHDRNAFVSTSKRASPESGLKTISKWMKARKLSSFCTIDLLDRALVLSVDKKAKDKDALLDGCYCIESDVSANAYSRQAIHDCYLQLQKVEQDFRTMKTALLETRPIFVRKESRTRGHIFVSMLSLKIARLMRQRLQSHWGSTDTNKHAETIDSALGALNRLCLTHYSIAEQTFAVLPRVDSRQDRILSALKVSLKAP